MIENIGTQYSVNLPLSSPSSDNSNQNVTETLNLLQQLLDQMKTQLQHEENQKLCEEAVALQGKGSALLEQLGDQLGQADFGKIGELNRLMSMLGSQDSSSSDSMNLLVSLTTVLSSLPSLLSSSKTADLQQLMEVLDASQRKIAQITDNPSLSVAEKRKEVLGVIVEISNFTRKLAVKAQEKQLNNSQTDSSSHARSDKIQSLLACLS